MSRSAAAKSAGSPVGLDALADSAQFEIEYDAVVAAIADHCGLQARYDIAELHSAYAAWIDSAAALAGKRDGAHLVAIVAALIKSLARHKAVSYALTVGARSADDLRLELALGFPNELTALLFGAAIYATAVQRRTGADPSIPLSRLILENAIGLLRRNPDGAAARFRELLQLAAGPA